MSGFAQALPFVLEMEGGYVNHPDDPGGATNQGITQATYDVHRRAVGLPVRSVKQIDEDEVQRIYHARYWLAGKCDALPWPLSLCHFDACVNHGIMGATKILQRALGVKDDGIHGPATQAAIDKANPGTLFGAWYASRLQLYYDTCQRKASQRVFLLGWVRRLVHLNAAIKGG